VIKRTLAVQLLPSSNSSARIFVVRSRSKQWFPGIGNMLTIAAFVDFLLGMRADTRLLTASIPSVKSPAYTQIIVKYFPNDVPRRILLVFTWM